MGATLAEICRRLETYGLKATLEGDGARSISGVATLEDATEGQISFLSNPKYEPHARRNPGLGGGRQS